jgi:CRP/FNR family transcriptional regulator, anaerobic regulatory protein
MQETNICSGRSETTACANCQVRLVSVCAALEPDELQRLDSLAQPACYPAKETLFIQGETADAVYNVTAGMVRLYKLLADGRRQIVGFALPGDFLGLALRDTYGFSADAVEPVVACRFSRAAYAALVNEKPHLLRRLHDFATHELTLAQDQMMLLGRRTAEEKLVSFLLGLRGRWAKLYGGRVSATVQLPMSRQDIADYLGLTIETVSRTFTKLAKDKTLLIVPEGVRLMNLARMETLAAA